MRIKSDNNYLKNEFYTLVKSDETFFEKVQNSLFDCFGYFDLNNFENVWLNVRFLYALGYQIEQNQNDFFTWEKLIKNTDIEYLKGKIKQKGNSNISDFFQNINFIKKNGEILTKECHFSLYTENEDKKRLLIAFQSSDSNNNSIYNKLEESETRFSLIANNIHDSIWIMNENFEFTFLSNSTEKLFGYTIEEWKTLEWGKFVEKDYLEEVNNLFIQLKTGNAKEIKALTIPVFHKTGDKLWVEYNATAIHDKNRNFAGIIGITRNVTGRKKIEEELIKAKEQAEENEKQLRASQRVAKIGYYFFDIKKGLWTSSKMLDEIFGIDENFKRDVQGWLSIIHQDFQTEMINYLQDNILKKHEDFNKRYKIINFKTKKDIWVHGLGSLEFDKEGNPEKMLGTIQDISQIKDYEREILKAKQTADEINYRFNLAMEATSDGLWDWNLETNEIYFSPRWKSILGYQDEELPNEFSVWEELTKPEDVKSSWEMLNKLLEGKIKHFYKEFQMLHKNGKWIDVLSRANVFYNESGKPYRVVGTHTDISDRKKSEKILQSNEERFRKLIDNMPSGVAVYEAVDDGKDFKFIDLNKEAEKITRSTKEELIGKTLLEKFPNMDKSPLISNLRKVYKEGKKIYIPPFYYKDNQREGWRENNIYKLKTGEIVAIFKDVTDIKEAEEKLKEQNAQYEAANEELLQINEELLIAKKEAEESETRFKALHNASFGGIAIHDKGVILDCNKGLADLTGFSYEELIGMDGLLLIAESKREFVLSQILKGYEEPYEAIGVRKNGEEYPIRLEARNIPYKGKSVRTVEFRDITNQKKYENDIIKAKEIAQENERKLKTLIENLQGVAYRCKNDKYWTMTFISNGVEELTGYKSEDLINNKKISWSDLVHDDCKEKIRKQINEALENKESFTIEYRIVDKNNNEKWLWEKAIGIYNNGKATHLEGFITDITPLKKYEKELISAKERAEEKEELIQQQFNELQVAEEELRASHEELRATTDSLKKINIELLSAKKRAEESDRLKTEFLNNMSHEIRTPMNGILGFSNLLNKKGITDEKRNNFITIIQNSSNQLLRIIDDILEISKLETKQVKVIENKTNLNDLLLEQFSIFDIKAKENKTPLYLKKELSDNQSIIYIDDVKLNKIVSNLLENAIKFTNEGYIELGYNLINNRIVIYVKDTGIGIKPENQNHIFERFSQEEKDLSKNVGGLGLGLSIAKENAELLDGKITLTSEKGKGSTFFVEFPYKPVFDNTNLTKELENQIIEKYNILIAEDEEVNYLYLETLFEEEIDIDFNITHAKNGLEAVDFCQKNRNYDLIFMDLKMPLMNGFDATKKIKFFCPNSIIIAQTAYTREEEKEQALNAGCADFISKPISIEIFKNIIRRYLIK